jgi:hypothetical protein
MDAGDRAEPARCRSNIKQRLEKYAVYALKLAEKELSENTSKI